MLKGGRIVSIIPCTQYEVFNNGHFWEDLPFFRHECKTFIEEIIRVHPKNLFAKKGNGFSGFFVQTNNCLHGCSFPGTVWPDKGDQLTLVDMKREIPDDLEVCVKYV